MARLPRIDAAGYPHHIIQRGNNRQAVFLDDQDYTRYLDLLRETAAAHTVVVHAYVLMTNHIHLLVTPQARGSLSAFMQALGRRYVRWFNERYGRTGTLWEGRFRSTVVAADSYFLACMRYIELNPVRAGLSADPSEYRWSSNPHHVGAVVDPTITDHATFWGLGNTPFERQSAYQRLFEIPLEEEYVNKLRRATNRGWALTAEIGTNQANRAAGEWPIPRPRGRPRARTR
jgi:putative transposase